MNTNNLTGYKYTEGGKAFKAIDPSSGSELDGEFFAASLTHVDSALTLAENAAQIKKRRPTFCAVLPKKSWP
jgi:alpha-ketoglutaric semialdehyde dehydrogenase